MLHLVQYMETVKNFLKENNILRPKKYLWFKQKN